LENGLTKSKVGKLSILVRKWKMGEMFPQNPHDAMIPEYFPKIAIRLIGIQLKVPGKDVKERFGLFVTNNLGRVHHRY